jgi:predicted amidophosphoribosyltransferase
MAKVVLAAKEENLRAAGATMAALMAQSLLWLAPEWLLSPGTLIPAPSRRRAKRRRGFDHAANLANSLTKLISGQVISPLEFSRGVQDQAHLSQSARLVNVSGRIRLPPRFINRLSNAPRPLVLLDDVLTSGATLRAAQAALLSRGFKAEFALVAASGASGHEANWRTF